MCYCPMDSDDQKPLVDVAVPSLGEAVTTAMLVVWHVELGEPTSMGSPLFEVGMDKTVFEVAAEVDGTLAEVLAPNGEGVTSGMIVGRIRAA